MLIGLLMICCADIVLFRYCCQIAEKSRWGEWIRTWKNQMADRKIFFIILFAIAFSTIFFYYLPKYIKWYCVENLFFYALIIGTFLAARPIYNWGKRYYGFFVRFAKFFSITGLLFMVYQYQTGLEETEESMGGGNFILFFAHLVFLTMFLPHLQLDDADRNV